MAKKVKKKSVKKAAKKKPAKKVAKKKAAKKTTKTKAKPVAKPKIKIKTVVKVVEKIVEKIVRVPADAPAKTTSISPYLTFNGNCEEAFNFYKSVFGGDFPYVGRFKDMPPAEGQPSVPESEGDKIMHVSLPIGNGSVLMGSDSSEAFGHANNVGNNFSISVNTTNDAEADRIFNGLSNGGNVTMPMAKTFWGSYFGMCVDKYGIQWMVGHEEPQNK